MFKNPMTRTEFDEEVMRMTFWDFKELDKRMAHHSTSIKDSFFNDIYGRMLTFIEAISDKDTVEQRKSIVKQLLREKQQYWLTLMHHHMENIGIQETRMIDWKETNVVVHKIYEDWMMILPDEQHVPLNPKWINTWTHKWKPQWVLNDTKK